MVAGPLREKFGLFEEKVLATIKKYRMLETGDRVLVAVSGGPDSVALLHILLQFQPVFDLKLHLFHLDHKMREESEKDASFVKRLAKKFALPVTALAHDVPEYIRRERLSPEEGARKIRYKLLEEVTQRINADKVALGHHADDQIETFLMRILQGAGIEGLQGIPPVREGYIRPLIEVTREEIEEYCRQRRIRFRRDPSNLDLTYLRNKIRFQLVPLLEEYNPGFRRNILKTIDLLKEEDHHLEKLTEKEFNGLAKVEKSLVKLALDSLKALPVALRRRVIRQGIEAVKGDLRGVEFKHIEKVLEYIDKGEPKLSLDLPRGLTIFGEYEDLVIAGKQRLKPPSISGVIIKVPGVTEIPSLGWRIEAKLERAKDLGALEKNNFAYLDASSLKLPLLLRLPLPGDRFVPLGMKGKKKLQDFFVDEKIPLRERKMAPIILSDEQIVWLVGLRIDDRFKITPETEKVLVLKAQKLVQDSEFRVQRGESFP